MIVDDAPALGKALPDQREHTADITFGASEMPMAENQRGGFVWYNFTKNLEAQSAMSAVGFH